MPRYILLSTLTTEGRKTVKQNPNRIKEVDDEIEKMGIKILKQYATLGPFDFINIVEAPNNDAISKLSIELTSRGTIQIKTLPAIDIDSFVECLKKMIKIVKRLLGNVKEQSQNVPGYKANKILRIYIYIGVISIIIPVLYFIIIFIYNSFMK